MEEVWKDIKEYEDLYQVSNFGRIRSLERIVEHRGGTRKLKMKIINQRVRGKGYLAVTLCKNSKLKHCYVHRLVAEAFIPNPNNLPQINHKDENKSNNNVDNLEWCDGKYNMNYGTRRLVAAKPRKRRGRVITPSPSRSSFPR